MLELTLLADDVVSGLGGTCEGAAENTQRNKRPKRPPELEGHPLHTRCHL
jgi:hypothetical protein